MNYVRSPDYSGWASPGGGDTQQPAFGWLPAALSFVRRRWPMMAGGMVLCLLLAAGYSVVATPKFTSTAGLLIDSRRADVFRTQAAMTDAQTENAVVESQVSLLQSEGVARAVVRKLDLQHDAEFMDWGTRGVMSRLGRSLGWLFARTDAGGPPDQEQEVGQAASLLQALMSVKRIGLSYVIEVAMTTPSAGRSAQLVNALTTVYIDSLLESKFETTRKAGEWLQQRLAELRGQSINADRAVTAFKARNNIIDTDKGLLNERELGDLNTALVAARARVADAEAKFTRIQAIKTENLSDAVVSDSLSSTLVGKLRQDYLDNTRKEAEWSARYGVNHTAAVNLRAQNRELQKSIAAELDRTREAYRSDVAVSRSNAASIQKQIDEVVARSTDTNAQRVELRALESLSDTYRSLYASFLQRYTQAAQDQSFPISEIRIVTAGSVPLKPSAPKLLVVLPLGAVLGLVLGFAGAFLLEMLDHKLRTAGQVRAMTGLDCLGLLPRLRRRDFTAKSRIKEEPAAARLAKRILSVHPSVLRAATDQPFSIYAETLRGVRAKLIQHRARARDLKVVGCVSAEAGEGKTTVAANLAQILAAAGHRTVLVDMDLRKPSLTRSIAAGSVAGIVDIVRGTATLDQAIWTDPKTGLHVIPAESTASGHDSVDILHSDSLAGTLDLLRADYDFVVLDLPPLGPVADSLDLGHIVDKLLVVVEWGKTDHEVLMEDLTRANFDAQRLLGVVLNKADLRAAGRYAGTSRSSQQYYGSALQTAS